MPVYAPVYTAKLHPTGYSCPVHTYVFVNHPTRMHNRSYAHVNVLYSSLYEMTSIATPSTTKSRTYVWYNSYTLIKETVVCYVTF